jgi:hypothetical protein
MRPVLLLQTIALVLFTTIALAQQIDQVTVIPTQISTDDEVFLLIEGQRLSSTMFIQTITVQQSGNGFTVNLEFGGEGVGLPVLSPFDTTVSLGTLAAGSYHATVTGYIEGVSYNSMNAQWIVSTVIGIPTAVPSKLDITAAPNPIVREWKLVLTLPEAANVNVRMFDILGKEVALLANGRFAAGKQSFSLSAASLPDGRYYVQAIINGKTLTRQVVKRSN